MWAELDQWNRRYGQKRVCEIKKNARGHYCRKFCGGMPSHHLEETSLEFRKVTDFHPGFGVYSVFVYGKGVEDDSRN